MRPDEAVAAASISEQALVYRPAPDCRACHGMGTYYEDVAGDGGSRMAVNCECWDYQPAAVREADKAPRSCCDSPDDPRTCSTCGTYPVCPECANSGVCSYCRLKGEEA